MKKGLLLGYGFISAIIFTILIANLDTLSRYFDSVFNTNIELFVSEHQGLYFYIIKLVFYFFNFQWCQKKFNQRPIFTFLSLIVPIILIDATVFIDGINLIPLRFPFETLFPILGAGGGLIITVYKKQIFVLYSCLVLFFIILSKFYFIPLIIHFMQLRDSNRVVNYSPFNHGYFLTLNGDSTKLEDTASNKCLLIDYYFVGCPPCEKKVEFMYELLHKVNSNDFRVILICDGKVSSYQKFIEDAKQKGGNGFCFLYDKNGIIKKTFSEGGYPYEILLNKKRDIVSTLLGFNSQIASKYIPDNYKIIKSILDE